MNSDFIILQLLNAMQYSMLLFLLSIGLTVIFGLLHFINLAHGALYMMGAYIGISIATATGNYWFAFALAPVMVALIGALLYWALLDRLRNAGHMSQVLVTFGLILIFIELVRIIWGDVELGLDTPTIFVGTTDLLNVTYPTYRLFIIGLGALMMGILWLILNRTQIGAIIRASVENETMAASLGINVGQLFFTVFCIGCALAGLAGIVAVPVFAATTGMGVDILIPALIVVVIGGLGSLQGAILGAFIVGFLEVFGAVFFPQIAAVTSYILLAAILILRPQGLLPARN
ncbi:MAG: branched-chain amino acid ABC transporter permease [Alphaproteobacteria bacterium]|nr:branched-chain amino acid ABC transporter permease [Alphaproteobacteria bacterium]